MICLEELAGEVDGEGSCEFCCVRKLPRKHMLDCLTEVEEDATENSHLDGLAGFNLASLGRTLATDLSEANFDAVLP